MKSATFGLYKGFIIAMRLYKGSGTAIECTTCGPHEGAVTTMWTFKPYSTFRFLKEIMFKQ